MARKATRSKPLQPAANGVPIANGKPLNRSLSAAKAAKQDESYTQYVDIQKEVEAYLEYDAGTFRGKIVYCNKLFLKKNKANRIPLKGNDQYPGADFRSPECVGFLKQADIVVTNPPFTLALACSTGYAC